MYICIVSDNRTTFPIAIAITHQRAKGGDRQEIAQSRDSLDSSRYLMYLLRTSYAYNVHPLILALTDTLA